MLQASEIIFAYFHTIFSSSFMSPLISYNLLYFWFLSPLLLALDLGSLECYSPPAPLFPDHCIDVSTIL